MSTETRKYTYTAKVKNLVNYDNCIALDKLLWRDLANKREGYIGIAEIQNQPNHCANARTQTP
jgi:hypothetical protein